VDIFSRIVPICCRVLHVDAPSRVLSLAPPAPDAENAPRVSQPFHLFRFVSRRMPLTVHTFEETINGREYHIEVSPVGHDQWRAQIARVPGGSRALMPFYGRTPDEAARQLSRWLSLAHGRPASQA
jgi:hypothetical protein